MVTWCMSSAHLLLPEPRCLSRCCQSGILPATHHPAASAAKKQRNSASSGQHSGRRPALRAFETQAAPGLDSEEDGPSEEQQHVQVLC